MPLQIVDGAGLRVGKIKDEYLKFIPEQLRPLIKQLNIIIQIPLPLIRNRSGFENENEYLPFIQKTIAIEFYKAVAFKVHTQQSPQFKFFGLSDDWRSNPAYDNIIDTLRYKDIIALAQKINSRTETLAEGGALNPRQKILMRDFDAIKTSEDYLRLILLLNFPLPGKKNNFTNLMAERLVYQIRMAQQEDERKKQLEEISRKLGINAQVRNMNARIKSKDPHSMRILDQIGVFKTSKSFDVEKNLVKEGSENADERLLRHRAEYLLRQSKVPVDNVFLVRNAPFAGRFAVIKGKRILFLKSSWAIMANISKHPGVIDAKIDTIVHETAHVLERWAEFNDYKADQEYFWIDGAEKEKVTTHESIGLFANGMKYMSGMGMFNWNSAVFNGADAAMLPAVDNRVLSILSKDKGGIDLTSANVVLQERNKEGEIKFTLDPAMLAQLQRTSGFTVSNIIIQPLKSLSSFLRK